MMIEVVVDADDVWYRTQVIYQHGNKTGFTHVQRQRARARENGFEHARPLPLAYAE